MKIKTIIKIAIAYACMWATQVQAQSWEFLGTSTVAGNSELIEKSSSQFGKHIFKVANGIPFVLFQEQGSFEIKVIKKENGEWLQVGPSLTNYGQILDMVVSPDGTPTVAYQDNASQQIKVKFFDGDSPDWVEKASNSIDLNSDTYLSGKLILRNSNSFSLCLHKWNPPLSNVGQLHLYTLTGGNWEFFNNQTVVSAMRTQFYDYTLDPSGVPLIAISNYDNEGKISLLSFNGANFTTITGLINLGDFMVANPKFAYDASNLLHLAYASSENNNSFNKVYVLTVNGSLVGQIGDNLSDKSVGLGVGIDDEFDFIINPNNNQKYLTFTKRNPDFISIPHIYYLSNANWLPVEGSNPKNTFSSRNMMLQYSGSELYFSANVENKNNEIEITKLSGSTWTIETNTTPGVAPGGTSVQMLVSENNVPYLFYIDNEAGGYMSVKTYSGGNWGYLGSRGFGVQFPNFTSYTIKNNVAYVCYKANGIVNVLSFSGANWNLISTVPGSSGATETSIVVENSGKIWVAFKNSSNNYLQSVYSYDAGSWSAEIQTGSSFYTNTELHLSSTNNLYTNYLESSPDYYGKVLKRTGNSFVSEHLGSSITEKRAYYTDLINNKNELYSVNMEYVFSNEKFINFYKFNGTNYFHKQNIYSISGGNFDRFSAKFGASGNPSIIYVDEVSGVKYLKGKTHNGSQWADFGPTETIDNNLQNFPVSLEINTTSGDAFIMYRGKGAGVFVRKLQRENQSFEGFPSDGEISYGSSNTIAPVVGLTLSLTSSNLSIMSVSGSTFIAMGLGVVTISGSNSGSAAFNPAFIQSTVTITKANMGIVGFTQNRVYGNTSPGFNLQFQNKASFDQINVSYQDFPASTPVGKYSVTYTLSGAALANYNVLTFNGLSNTSLVVEKRPLIVGVQNTSKVYGSANPAFTHTISGLVSGETVTVTYSTLADGTSSVGNYAISASISGVFAPNYEPTINNGVLNITPKSMTITSNNFVKPYGQELQGYGYSSSGLVNSDDVYATYFTTVTSTTGVGVYPIIPVPSGSVALNYNITTIAGTITVTRTNLMVSANSATRTYGDPNPAFTYTTNGLVANDVINVSLASIATPTSAANAVYPIEISVTGTALANYNLSTTSNNMSVVLATITATSDNFSRLYQANNPVFTGNILGVKNAENYTQTFSSSATSSSNVGTYTISSTVTGGATLSNYTVVKVDGTLTILPKASMASISGVNTSGNPQSNVNAIIVTISGSGFLAGATASVNGISLTNISISGSGNIIASLPANVTSPFSFSVTNPNENPSSSQIKEPVDVASPKATVGGVNMDGNPSVSTTQIIATISGSGFVSGTSVSVNGVALSNTTFVGSNTLLVKLPLNTSIPFEITTQNPFQSPLLISSIKPIDVTTPIASVSGFMSNGNLQTGTLPLQITISGADFVNGLTVTINGVALSAVNFVNSTSIIANIPSHISPTFIVQVQNPNQIASTSLGINPIDITVPIATVSGMNTNGNPSNATSPVLITLTGSGFVNGIGVTVNGVALTDIVVVNGTTLTATLPAGLTAPFTVSVQNPNQVASTSANVVVVDVTTSLSSSDLSLSTFSIIPNPVTNGEFRIENAKLGEMQIVNSLGKVMYSSLLTSPSTNHSISLPAGVYLVKLGGMVKKLVVE